MIYLENALLVSKGHRTAEGPVWDTKRRVFFYTDIENGTLHQYNPRENKVVTWELGVGGQMIGGGIALNKDGSLIVLLERGLNEGVNYFTPETGELVNIPNSWPERNKINNRPNDSTVVNWGGKNRLVFGTMSKEWKADLEKGQRGGAFYVVDDCLKPQRLIIDEPYPGTVISNGLADGGRHPDGSLNLFWAESIGFATHAKVWIGTLNPSTLHIQNVTLFADYSVLAGECEAYPDGANMIMVDGKVAYAIAMLGIGEIRAFDPQRGNLVARIKLPEEIKDITKFAIGEDGRGASALLVTTLNFEWSEGQESLNGAVFLLSLPPNVSQYPASVQITDYITKEEAICSFGLVRHP